MDAAGELDVSAGWDDERLVAGHVEGVLAGSRRMPRACAPW
ncbi:hypothetical protein [Streptomyces nigrescens]